MMNTNQFDKDIKLLDVLSTSFDKKINKARIKFIYLFISILCKVQYITLYSHSNIRITKKVYNTENMQRTQSLQRGTTSLRGVLVRNEQVRRGNP